MSSWPYRILASLLTLTSLLASVPAPAVGEAPTVTSLTLDPTTVTGGAVQCYCYSPLFCNCWSGSGTVTLSGPAPPGGLAVGLSSNNAAVATVPASVTVPAGQTTAKFLLGTSPVADSTTVTISASYGGVTKTAALGVLPIALVSLELHPTSVTGGDPYGIVRGIAILSAPPPGGSGHTYNVGLSSNMTSVATVPAAELGGREFYVRTNPVVVSTSVSISASFRGITKTAVLGVMPHAVASLTLNPTSVIGGAASTGTVFITAPAPYGGAAISLSSSNPAVATVSTGWVTVPAEATTTTFTVRTNPVASSTRVYITAIHHNIKGAALEVLPPQGVVPPQGAPLQKATPQAVPLQKAPPQAVPTQPVR